MDKKKKTTKEKNSPLEKNSPPPEGCPQGGVASTSPPYKIILTTINNTAIIRNFVENIPYNPALNRLAKEKEKKESFPKYCFGNKFIKDHFTK